MAKRKLKEKINTESNIERVSSEEIYKTRFGDYAKYIILSRALPDNRDGLKPVQRRILYAMYMSGNVHNSPYRKSAKSVGDVMANYHPHGDCLLNTTRVRLTNGQVKTIEELYKEGKDVEIFAVDKNNNIVPAIAHSFRIGQYANKLYKITLSDGRTITTTNNHPFLMATDFEKEGHVWKKAEHLKEGNILYSGYMQKENFHGYKTLKSKYSNNFENLLEIHKIFGDMIFGVLSNSKDFVIHHIDENKSNNETENLLRLSRAEHALIHGDYLKGLELGHQTMKTELKEKIRLKNSYLMKQYNANQGLFKAFKIIDVLNEKGLKVSTDNYEEVRKEFYNYPKIENMIERKQITDFDDLITLYNKKEEFKITFDKVIYEELNLNEEEIKKSTTKTKETIGKTRKVTEQDITVTSIEIVDVEKEPMYDFTVDNHENMLLFNDLGNGFESFIVAHNSSIYEAMIRQGQNWVINLPLVDTHGNNGSIDGDSPAAMRYTESRLQKVVSDFVMNGIKKKGIVDMIPTFDDSDFEPVTLPTRIPLAVVNGAEGISSGYSTEILPHNLTEVMKGLIFLFDNEEATNEELLELIPAPDFPTGGVLTGAKYYKSAFINGKFRGGDKKPQLRCKYHIDESDKKENIICVTEIPYGVNKTKLVRKIDELCRLDKKDKNKLSSLLGVNDLSDKDGILIQIYIDKTADIKTVMAYLFNKTELQLNINPNYTVIDDKKPVIAGIKRMLVSFNKYRKETVIKELTYDKEKLERSLHLTEGFIKLSDIIEDVVAVIKESKGKDDARKKIISEFDFSEQQAEAIVTMALHRISKTDKDKYIQEKKKLERGIASIASILNSRVKLKNYIVKQYEEVIENYGYDRKTELIMEEENWEITKIDTVEDEEVYVGVSKMGYIKRSTPRSYSSTDEVDYLEGDSSIYEGKVSTKDVLMVFTSKCNYMYIPVYELEDSRWKSVGKHMGTIITSGLEEGEEVINAFVINPEKDGDKLIFTAKNDGKVKRTPVKEHIVTKRFTSTFPCIKKTGDELLVSAELVENEKDGFIGFKNNLDKNMFFSLEEVAPKGLKTEGMRGIHLKDGEIVTEAVFSLDKQVLIDKGYNEKTRGSRGTK